MCEDCKHLQSAIEDMKDQLEAERLTTRRQARVELDLRRKLEAKDADDDQDPQVKALLSYAKKAWGKNNLWETGAATDRYQLVDKTLRGKIKLAKKQGHKKEKALEVAFDWCRTVMFGLSLVPYVGPRGRSGLPYPGAKKLIDVVYCFGDDERWERCWLEATGLPWSDNPETEAADREWVATSIVPAENTPQWNQAMRSAKQAGEAVRAIQPLLFKPKEDPVDAIIHGLERLGLSWKCSGGSNWMAQCPAHDDRAPSFKFHDAGDKVVFICHAGCERERILEALDLQWSDLFREDRRAA